VLIVTYQHHELFGRCFELLRRATADQYIEFVVVVNGVPLRVEHRMAEAAGATLVHPPVNLGLAGGLHAARAQARGRYLAIVQDDVEVMPGWLEPLIETLDDDPSVGAVASRVERTDGGLQHEGMIVWRDASVRGDAWDDVGGPDLELFPVGYIDIDLCLCLAGAEWNVMVEPRSVVRHRMHSSTTSMHRSYLNRRHRPRVIRRHAALLEHRPERDEAPEGVAAQIRRCAEDATRRRSEPRPVPTRRHSEPMPMDRLVRHARRQALVLRAALVVWRVRVLLWRGRQRVQAFARSRGS
jgi:GT2 family glycosyltransferase